MCRLSRNSGASASRNPKGLSRPVAGTFTFYYYYYYYYYYLYGCETWSLILREEFRQRVFENRVLRRIFGPKRDEITGEWRRLHNKELYAVYLSPDIIRVIKSRRLR
jgi:hypothetical protein